MASVERSVKYNPLYKKDLSHSTLTIINDIGWPDTVQGLSALKKQVIIATLSNGNVRLLVDMVIDFLYPSLTTLISNVTNFVCYRRSIRISLGMSYFPRSCLIHSNRSSSPLSSYL